MITSPHTFPPPRLLCVLLESRAKPAPPTITLRGSGAVFAQTISGRSVPTPTRPECRSLGRKAPLSGFFPGTGASIFLPRHLFKRRHRQPACFLACREFFHGI